MIRKLTLVFLILLIHPPQAPLSRSFSPNSSSCHLVRLTLRTELRGHNAVKIGLRHYLEPFTRAAEIELSWIATRRILSITPDGAAEIEESLSDFSRSAPSISFSPPSAEKENQSDPETEKLAASLSSLLDSFSTPVTFRYRESPSGHLGALGAGAAPPLGESSPHVLTLWLLRALRPTATLPDQPLRLNNRWSSPRTATLENWTDISASESGEWLPATSLAANLRDSARLLITQQLSAKISAGPDLAPEGRSLASFHSESLSTLSLSDARLLSADRTASREIIWLLTPIPLPQSPSAANPPQQLQPEFRARLSARVLISLCDPDCPR